MGPWFRRWARCAGGQGAAPRAPGGRTAGGGGAMAADLVVVRLDVRVGDECLVDTFCWCAADRDRAGMHAFATTLVQDAGLPAAFVAPVVDAMWTQISNDVKAGESSVTRATTNERLEKIQCGATFSALSKHCGPPL